MALILAQVGNFRQYFNADGDPLAGGKLFTYYANSTTSMATTYTTIAGNIANPNPIELDSSGYITNAIWLNADTSYQFVLTAADGTTVIQTINSLGYNASQSLPNQTGHAGEYLTTDGTSTSWAPVNGGSLPDQSGNAGKYLYTDGTDATWVEATYAAAFKPQVFTFTYAGIDLIGIPTSPITADELYVSTMTYAELDGTSVYFFDPGTYRVDIQAQFLNDGDNQEWFTFRTSYGPNLVTDTSMSVVGLFNYLEHFTHTDTRDTPFDLNGPSFNDTFIIQTAAEQLLDIQLWVYSFHAEGELATADAVVTITRLSDDAGPWE